MSSQEQTCIQELLAMGDLRDITPLQVTHTASGARFWTGTYVPMGTHCFIKRYAPVLAQDALREIEFTRAMAETIQRMQHQKIGVVAPLKHYILKDSSIVLVTPFLHGETLEEMRVRQVPFSHEVATLIRDGLLTWAQVLLETNIAHRDICPKNFMVTGQQLVLIDFQTAIKKQNPVYRNPTIKQIKSLGGLGAGYSPNRGQWNDVFSLARTYEEVAHLMPLSDNAKTIQSLFEKSKAWQTLQNDFIVTRAWQKAIYRDYLKVLFRPAWTCKPQSRAKRAYVLETVQRLLRAPAAPEA